VRAGHPSGRARRCGRHAADELGGVGGGPGQRVDGAPAPRTESVVSARVRLPRPGCLPALRRAPAVDADRGRPTVPELGSGRDCGDRAVQRAGPAVVATQLATAADTLASRLDDVHGYQWERPGRRSDGALFTVATFVRYFIHDPIHHLHDVTGRRYPYSDETDRRGTRDHAAGRAGAILWSNSPEPYQTVRDRRGLRGVGRGRVGCRSSRWRVCGRRMGGFGGCRSGRSTGLT